MTYYRIAAAIKRSFGEEFLLVRLAPPPPLDEDEYHRYVDSNLWDLPSAPLKPLEGEHQSKETIIGGADSLHEKLDLRTFDIELALSQIASQLGRVTSIRMNWSVLKYVEEAEFGPDSSIKTLFILGTLARGDEEGFSDSCKWMAKDSAANSLLQSTPSADRIGPLTAIGLLQGSDESRKFQPPPIFLSRSIQEYPTGIMVIPMKSRTLKPFSTTNLVLIVAEDEASGSEHPDAIKHGDALLVDPGCSVQHHSDLEVLVKSLPRKLLVFLTHHHSDHVDGLSVINRCNPDAILLAHERTLRRIAESNWSHQPLMISGGEKIQIGNQKLEAVSAPGHTDGHIALLHLNTQSLIAGDHCVGQGSAVLDATSGGNMKDYFQTTYRFLELKPSVLIPMHGRISLWPQRMLCEYLKHRRDREARVLEAIEDGAESLYDVVAGVYAGVGVGWWLAASSNVRLHVDHLAYRGMLPKDFCLQDFNDSYDAFIKKISAFNIGK